MANMERAHEILKSVFGFDGFRLAQEQAIENLLNGRNTAVIFPTGGGKSLVYQVPGLCFDGLTLVISPLISLMKDQVDSLVRRGVKAASLDSSLSAEEASTVKQGVLSGDLKLLYVAPERLNNENFVRMISQVTIDLLAVDEAHCISQWGMSFRPEYLKIARMVQESNVRRVLCLTATATPPVVEDMRRAFQIDESSVFQTPVYRPNLHLRVEAAETLDQKVDILVPLLETRTGPAIVYVTLQKHTDDVASALEARGLKDVLRYHAGLPQDERKRIQDTFMAGQSYIVVATIAFGMGIDKADIRQVVHFYMPKTLENYSQEIGRAGRDGLPSTCVLFMSSLDIPALQGFCCGDTCAKRDVELWLHTVTSQAPASDGTLSFNLYEQSKLYDIRSNVLNLLYAQLELDFGYIRAVTPFYSIYEISPRDSTGRSNILNDKSAEATHIRSFWRVKREKFEINVVDAAARINIDRSLLANKIMRWELDGHIQTRPSQVRARFLVLKPFPTAKEELAAITDEIYAGMEKREADGIAKLQEVIKFATEDDCLSSGLSVYFGGENTVPEDGCGTCTFCMKGQGVDFKPKTTDQVDEAKIAAILAACGERDDPRLLARMAFGITSPRLTALKCSTGHALFGSMGDCDFNALIAAFDAECAKVDYQNQAIVVPSTSQKRTYSQTTGGRGGSGASKRARGGRGGRR